MFESNKKYGDYLLPKKETAEDVMLNLLTEMQLKINLVTDMQAEMQSKIVEQSDKIADQSDKITEMKSQFGEELMELHGEVVHLNIEVIELKRQVKNLTERVVLLEKLYSGVYAYRASYEGVKEQDAGENLSHGKALTAISKVVGRPPLPSSNSGTGFLYHIVVLEEYFKKFRESNNPILARDEIIKEGKFPLMAKIAKYEKDLVRLANL